MTNDPHTLVGPYVLHALPPDERDLFQEHLDRCSDCRTEAAELMAAAAHLGQAAAVVPPAALRDVVMADVARTRQVAPGPPVRRAAPRRSWPTTLVAAAAISVVVALGALLVQADHRADRAQDITAVVAAPDARSVTVRGEGATMRLVLSEEEAGAVVIAEDMAAPPPGKTYALWFGEGSRMVPAGLFSPDSDGSVRTRVDAVPAGTVGVTVEDAGGVDQPTSPVIASGTVQ